MAKAKSVTGELVALDHSIPPGSNLAKKLMLLAQASQAWGESFFKIGTVLRSIYEDEDWRDANYTSFEEFMNDQKPLGMVARYGQRMMAAASCRLLLPDLNGDGRGDRSGTQFNTWTEYVVRPLTHKDFKPADVRRLGKRIATRVNNGEKLTSTLTKKICDEDRGVERKAKIHKEKIFTKADLSNNLKLGIEIIIGLKVGYQNYYEDSWIEVEEANPHLVRTLITELGDLTSFLKE